MVRGGEGVAGEGSLPSAKRQGQRKRSNGVELREAQSSSLRTGGGSGEPPLPAGVRQTKPSDL